MTTRRIRLLVEKTANSDTWSILFLSEERHLVEKKNNQVSDFAFFRFQVNSYFQVLFKTRPLVGVYVKQQHIHMSKIHINSKND